MNSPRPHLLAVGLLSLVPVSGLSAAEQSTQSKAEPTLPAKWIEAFRWRSIGPANMSGRITSIAVYEKDPSIWWAATASGGLLKTTDNGVTFEHQFDRQATVSIGDVQVARSDPSIVWVGTGEANPRNSVSWGDGVYKSTDGGKTWKNMGLKKIFQTGRIAIHPKDPNTVYVGALGRLWGPNEERGLFKTTDGGKTWEKILYVDDKTGVVDVQMHPKNPDTLIVATYERQRDGFDSNDPAKKFGSGSALYKTANGGRTFKKLTKGLPDCKLGRIGIGYYRRDPKIVYVVLESEKIGQEPPNAAYAGIRGSDAEVGARITDVIAKSPAEKAGVKKGDIVVAIDGVTVHSYADLVREMRGRVAGDKAKLEVSRARKGVELEITFTKRPKPKKQPSTGGSRSTGRPGTRSPFGASLGGQRENLQDQQGKQGQQYGGVYRSEDGGESWTRINTVNPRPMYYSQIRVDPRNNKYIYVLGTRLYRSVDGGETFTPDGARGGVHVDHHAMWIDPRDPRHMILGNDGGIYVTHDRMGHWDHYNHVAIGQFYHVAVGPRRDYRVYGGLQDNGSWGGPSRTRSGAGPVNSDWIRIGGGDGFLCLVDPDDADQIYFESQNGRMGRINLRTGERGYIRPQAPKGVRYRFNWKTPFVLSHHNPRIHYSAGNHVFRSIDRGNRLKAISPEITNTDRGSGSAIAESPLDGDVLYVGTTDGALWMTRNGGKDWTDLFA
ncbi:MAG: WD40/YVTN/BNR-like repeat-containing protein, partial [Planctomycetota bacterium]